MSCELGLSTHNSSLILKETSMSKRLLATMLALGLIALSCGRSASARADTPPSSLGTKLPPFELKDATGKVVSSENFHDKKALVVVFTGTECPINNAYMPRLAKLAKDYAEQGVQFLGVNSNRQDSAERVAAHAKKHALTFPV